VSELDAGENKAVLKERGVEILLADAPDPVERPDNETDAPADLL